MGSRSPTSSPDPLEFPGDPKFLLSSARKPIPRRFTLSPRKSRSPQRRISQSPEKGLRIEPIQFNDFVLPSTPPRGRSSLSPSKTTLRSEGNVSPWRIRVTVEAERDDEEGDGMAGLGNGISPWKDATAIKVPLKGGTSSTEPSPKKRRTPRKKSTVANRVPTPRRRKSNQLSENDDAGNTPKRRRGRPRKSLQSIDANKDTPKAPSPHNTSTYDDPFLDIAADKHVGGDSLADGLESDGFGYFDTAASDKSSVNTHSPNPEPLKAPMDQENRSTPRPASSPPGPEGSSPGNTLHAGRTPRHKPGLYPTPTSSSVLDEGSAEDGRRSSPRRERAVTNPRIQRLKDPTTEHREFDSIMESEQFSMVSLATLPSAKQQLSGAAKAGFNAASSALSESQRSKRKSYPSSIIEEHEPSISSSFRSRRQSHLTPTYPTLPDVPNSASRTTNGSSSLLNGIRKRAVPSPPHQAEFRRKPLSRLARVIHTGIALRGVIDRYRDNTRSDEEAEAAKQRLDVMFRDFDTETRKYLSAGLRFGDELARMSGPSREGQTRHQSEDRSSLSSELGSPPKITTPSSDSSEQQSPATRGNSDNTVQKVQLEMARREAEWQREREAISRRIQQANSSQIIVIDDEEADDAPSVNQADVDDPSPFRERSYSQVHAIREQEVAQEEYDEGRDTLVSEDEEYDDIWQQQARREIGSAPPTADSIPPPRPMFPPLEIEDIVEPGGTQRAPPSDLSLLSGRKTQMARYRNGDFEFSSIVGTPESATRRFYQGDVTSRDSYSSPQDGLQSARPRRAVKLDRETPVSYPEIPKTPPSYEGQSTPTGSSPEHSAEDRQETPAESEYSDQAEEHHLADHHVTSAQASRLPEQSPPPISPGGRSFHEHAHGMPQSANPVETGSDYDDDHHQSQPDEIERPAITSLLFNKLTQLAPSWLLGRDSHQSRNRTPKEPTPDDEDSRPSTSHYIFPSPVEDEPERASLPYPAPKHPKPVPPPDMHNQRRKALAVQGYFTDDHYYTLRHLYWQAKKDPDIFPYDPSPENEALLGRWISPVGGNFQRQVTKIQLAIVDRFTNDLISASRRRGGSDKMEWTKVDLLWRLWSIMVGEKIRRERKLANRNGSS